MEDKIFIDGLEKCITMEVVLLILLDIFIQN